MKKRLYAGAISAVKTTTQGTQTVSAVWMSINPVGINEAHGIAYTAAIRRWPHKNGFSNHAVTIDVCPQELLDAICEDRA